MFSNIHHIAIIGTNYQKTREFYVEKLGFKVISEYNRTKVIKGDFNYDKS